MTSIDRRALIAGAGLAAAMDVVERNSIAQDQTQALLAAELALTAQKAAARPGRG